MSTIAGSAKLLKPAMRRRLKLTGKAFLASWWRYPAALSTSWAKTIEARLAPVSRRSFAPLPLKTKLGVESMP